MAGADARLSERILLIGGAGLVGRHLRDEIADQRTVVTTYRASVPGGIAMDLRDHDAVRAVVHNAAPDVIVLAAADANVERCEREPEASRRVNVGPVVLLAELARRREATLVVFSSEYVFDGTAGVYDEDDPVRPLNEYGRQKVELEQAAASAGRHLVCRTSGVFGWEAARKNFVCQVIDSLRAGKSFTVPSDQVITPTYAPDLSRAVLSLIAAGANGVVHVCGPRILLRPEFAALVANSFALPAELLVPVPTDELSLAAPRPRRAGLRDSRLRSVLGAPLRDPVDALADMAAAQRPLGAGVPPPIADLR